MLWQTQTGDVIEISDMTTEHINNCIKLIQRRMNEVPPSLREQSDPSLFAVGFAFYRQQQLLMLTAFRNELGKRDGLMTSSELPTFYADPENNSV